jgi:Ca2+-binding EF-hand superfamily protein
MADVIQVPGEHRDQLLLVPDALRIQEDDCDTWRVPTQQERNVLENYLGECKELISRGMPVLRHKKGAGSDSIRVGFNAAGVFVHFGHCKRYYGLVRNMAGIRLQQLCPEAVEKWQGMTAPTNDRSTGGFIGALSQNMGRVATINDDVRNSWIKATFITADKNKNGVLSRPEVSALFRKVFYTMSSKAVEYCMQEADKDGNGVINYPEFVDWLNKSAPETVKKRVSNTLSTDVDLIRATFRLWDKDGDGLIPNRVLERLLKKINPSLTDKQVQAMVTLVDASGDGQIDYDEFVDFIAGGAM